MKKVGLLVGREWSWPPAFIDEVSKRGKDVSAELVKLGGTLMGQAVPYAVNNPFMWTADDKFFDASLATKLGVAHPKTVALPNKDYVPGIVPSESLRNLVYPLDWYGIIDYVGMPCILKDAFGGGGRDVYVCRSIEELLHYYNRFGLGTAILQEFIEFEQYVRCISLGQEEVLPIKYDPRERK